MKKVAFLLFVSSLLLIMQVQSYASQLDQAKLLAIATKYLEAHREDEHISAIQLSVRVRGEQPISAVAGSRSYDQPLTMNNSSLFQIGSITKSFITAIILQLEADPAYQLSINDTLGKLLPQYPRWQNVTVKQLMNMTSGIPSYTDSQEFYDLYKSSPYRDFTPEELVNIVAEQDFLFQPGQGWHYCNTNYLLLGMIIEKLTGHTLTGEISTRLIKPLHLKHTVYMPFKPTSELLSNMVSGYFYRLENEDPALPPGTDMTMHSLSWGGAAGAIVSNADDVAHWAEALLTPGQILDETQYRELTELVSTKTGQPLPHPTPDDRSGFGMGIGYGFLAPSIPDMVYAYEGMTLAGRGFYIYEPVRGILIAGTLNSSVDNRQDHYTDLLAEIYALAKQ